MYIYIYNLSTFSYQLADRNSSSYWRKKERKGTIFIENNYAPHRHRRFIRLDVSSDSLLPNLHPRTFFDYLKGQKRSIEASPPPSLPPLYRVTCTVHAPRARVYIRACVCVCMYRPRFKVISRVCTTVGKVVYTSAREIRDRANSRPCPMKN